MLCTVCGARKSDFTGKDGGRVVGTKFYLQFKEDGLDGFATASVFVPSDKLPSVFDDLTAAELVGLEVEASYNKYGRLSSVVPA